MDKDFTSFYIKQWERYGSNSPATLLQRKNLANVVTACFRELRVQSVLDAPCGEFDHYMQFVDLTGINYIGYDLNPHAIAANNRTATKHTFIQADIVEETIPKVDIIICRSFLFHMTLKNALKTLANFRSSGSTWLMATTTTRQANLNSYVIQTSHPEWGFRELDLELEPFLLGVPALKYLDPVVPHKTERFLGVWQLTPQSEGALP